MRRSRKPLWAFLVHRGFESLPLRSSARPVPPSLLAGRGASVLIGDPAPAERDRRADRTLAEDAQRIDRLIEHAALVTPALCQVERVDEAVARCDGGKHLDRAMVEPPWRVA